MNNVFTITFTAEENSTLTIDELIIRRLQYTRHDQVLETPEKLKPVFTFPTDGPGLDKDSPIVLDTPVELDTPIVLDTPTGIKQEFGMTRDTPIILNDDNDPPKIIPNSKYVFPHMAKEEMDYKLEEVLANADEIPHELLNFDDDKETNDYFGEEDEEDEEDEEEFIAYESDFVDPDSVDPARYDDSQYDEDYNPDSTPHTDNI